MNKLEAEYAGAILEPLRLAGEIVHYAFEPLKLRLADRTYYDFDFLVQPADGSLEAHEVKGFWEDDARVKWKMAAELHGYLRFYALTKEKGVWYAEPAFKEDREPAARYGAVRSLRVGELAGVAGAARAQGRRVAPPRKNV
jgi:hypothetical protein